ncbi:MAG: YjjG family noncanonical pyrimidine nucleotidase [Faecalibacterium sp.]|nr:YjjG family noncanonical pyrimidine nucleotidase [Ruminococcus sp.]MCM1391853.1 YjjG family noncanonical pyrimidine nucleotidase [Ruminococcus sp.]MCM1485717.1 YjjG family noncanonical pyrimidine nucleotidase [Faecalibacterium sp.]
MKKYTTILFDVDDTLLDFHQDEHDALKTTLEQCDLPSDESIIATYSKINSALWKEHEQGRITKEDIKNMRFHKLFERFNFMSDYAPRQVNDIYERNLCGGSNVVSGAYKICEKLKEEYRLYIVTNGIEFTQKSRLSRGGFDKLMSDMFISETIGMQKPDRNFFDYVFSRIEETDKSKIVLIGDSLSSDIKGALEAGIDCIWFNKSAAENNTELKPTYIIGSLEEIMSIL